VGMSYTSLDNTVIGEGYFVGMSYTSLDNAVIGRRHIVWVCLTPN
jgi:carbonic anhydrase/acetyltransferase-like protein (isoleucine patch superfamily)